MTVDDRKLPRIVAVTGLAIEARIASGRDVRAIAAGGGAQQLTSVLESALVGNVAAVISFGIAGGLANDVVPGAWIVARAIVTRTTCLPCDAVWTRILAERLRGARVADLAGSDSPVTDPAAKRSLHEATGAVAVDMESHIAAAIAAARRLPFAAFRVIADDARTGLPSAAIGALKPDGKIDGVAVFRSLTRAPAQAPLVMRTAIDAGVAIRSLSRGRRLLGRGLGYPNLGELLVDVT